MRLCGQCGNLDKRKNPPCKLGLPCEKSEKTGEYIRPSKCKKKAVKAKIAREKQSDSSLNKQLDKLWSKAVRTKGYCELCGRKPPEVILHAHHIFSRRNYSTRYDLENAVCLCTGCHLYKAHKDVQEFSDWVLEHLGQEYIDNLRKKAHSIIKYTKEDKIIIIDKLKNFIDNKDKKI